MRSSAGRGRSTQQLRALLRDRLVGEPSFNVVLAEPDVAAEAEAFGSGAEVVPAVDRRQRYGEVRTRSTEMCSKPRLSPI